MSIKLINHRRRLLHKRAYKPPHKRHKNDNLLLTKAEKIRLNKERKLAAKNRSNKKLKKKLAQDIEDIDEDLESYEEIEEIIQPEKMMDMESFKESLDYSENEFYDVKDFVRQNWEGRMNDL